MQAARLQCPADLAPILLFVRLLFVRMSDNVHVRFLTVGRCPPAALMSEFRLGTLAVNGIKGASFSDASFFLGYPATASLFP